MAYIPPSKIEDTTNDKSSTSLIKQGSAQNTQRTGKLNQHDNKIMRS